MQVTGGREVFVPRVIYNPSNCSAVVVQVQVEFKKVEKAANFPDPGVDAETEREGRHLGPYDATDGQPHRQIRSFRQPLQVRGATSVSHAERIRPIIPSDLRVDGYYSERHAGLAYWIDEEQSFDTRKGTMSFWFKPNFDPASTGKVRTLASVARIHRANYHHRNPMPFTLWFLPAHSSSPALMGATYSGRWPGAAPSGHPMPLEGGFAGHRGISRVPRASLMFGMAWSTFDGIGWDGEWEKEAPTRLRNWMMERYAVTPTTNVGAVDARESRRDGLRANRWSHVTMSWSAISGAPSLQVWLNGRLRYGHAEIGPSGSWTSWGEAARWGRPNFTVQSFIDSGDAATPRFFVGEPEAPTDRVIANTVRLGEVSTHGFPDLPRNFSSDGTYDEFFLWNQIGPKELSSPTLKGPVLKYRQGRYHVPTGRPGDATWSSPPLFLRAKTPRGLAPPSETSIKLAGPGLSIADNGVEPVRLLGVAWTWYAEDYRIEDAPPGRMAPVMYDYRDADEVRALPQSRPCARVIVQTDGLVCPPGDPEGFADDAFSPIEDTRGEPVILSRDGRFQYLVRFVVEGAMAGPGVTSVLLSTPVFDDVTVYYSTGLEYIDCHHNVWMSRTAPPRDTIVQGEKRPVPSLPALEPPKRPPPPPPPRHGH